MYRSDALERESAGSAAGCEKKPPEVRGDEKFELRSLKARLDGRDVGAMKLKLKSPDNRELVLRSSLTYAGTPEHICVTLDRRSKSSYFRMQISMQMLSCMSDRSLSILSSSKMNVGGIALSEVDGSTSLESASKNTAVSPNACKCGIPDPAYRRSA